MIATLAGLRLPGRWSDLGKGVRGCCRWWLDVHCLSPQNRVPGEQGLSRVAAFAGLRTGLGMGSGEQQVLDKGLTKACRTKHVG